jgi:hypothetical protein
MIKFYKLMILLGKITLDDVPVKWHTQVQDELESEV